MQFLKITLIFILFSCSYLKAQNDSLDFNDYTEPDSFTYFIFNLTTGIPTYNISELRSVMISSMSNLPFHAKLTDDYPKNPFFKVELLTDLRVFDVGIAISYLSTGARIHYADYSGEFKLDNIISCTNYGIVVKSKGPDEKKPLKLQFWAELGLSKTDFRVTEYYRLLKDYDTQKSSMSSVIYYIEPGIKINYLYNRFIVGTGISFLIEREKEFSFGFEGVRFNLGIAYLINL